MPDNRGRIHFYAQLLRRLRPEELVRLLSAMLSLTVRRNRTDHGACPEPWRGWTGAGMMIRTSALLSRRRSSDQLSGIQNRLGPWCRPIQRAWRGTGDPTSRGCADRQPLPRQRGPDQLLSAVSTRCWSDQARRDDMRLSVAQNIGRSMIDNSLAIRVASSVPTIGWWPRSDRP